ncbi:hypothetical protein HPB51_004202 [Rhipicephalus microplus]|uniref:Uncharacterized protein n=1 Tax=Rhipicephalus microplus TaxID=6941 RepID=A0A9J6DZC4_RHIMP|nr:hypothetical protein HPB51_004202 [Rhipicephalus microplus]
MCACMCRAVPTRKTTAREARPRAWVTRAFGSARGELAPGFLNLSLVPLVVESWRRVPEPALCAAVPGGWRGFPRRTAGAQGHNSLPPEHVTTPPNVDVATEWCRRGINDGPGYYPDDLNCNDSYREKVLVFVAEVGDENVAVIITKVNKASQYADTLGLQKQVIDFHGCFPVRHSVSHHLSHNRCTG